MNRVNFRYEDFILAKDNKRFEYDALNFFNKYTGMIEIVRNNFTELVYFPILPYAEALQSDQKLEWLSSLPVGKPRAKIDTFMANSLDYIQQLNNEYLFSNILRYYILLGAVTKQIPLFKSFTFYLSIVINIFMIGSYRKQGTDWDTRLATPLLFYTLDARNTWIIFQTFAGILTISYAIILVAGLYKHILSNYNKLMLSWEDSKGGKGCCKNKSTIIIPIIKEALTGKDIYLNIANFVISLLGWTAHPILFTFHLLTDVFRSTRLLNVLKAIIEPAVEILLTLLLYIVLEYIFAMTGYTIFAQDYPDYACATLLSCFFYGIDMTFKENGGVGATLTPVYIVHEEREYISIDYIRVIFDFLFGLIMTMIIVQLLSGLIIDKFKSLRDESQKIEDDMKAACLICSETAESIERKTGKTIDDHTNSVHNPWFYLMFIGYLVKKPKLDLSGIESYIYENFKQKKIDWLPCRL